MPVGWADDIGESLPPSVATDSTAPEFSLVDLSGITRTLAAHQGKVTLLKFWATWCPHCRTDVPLIKELALKYQQRPFQVITISVDQDLDALKRFLREQKVTYPVIATSDPEQPEANQLSDRYEVRGIPAYYLVDATGAIVSRRSGSYLESKAQGELEETIKTLLADLP